MENERPATGPFRTSEECLEAWFLALGPMTGSGSDHPTGIVPIEARLPHLQRLAARTAATRRVGVAVPVLEAIETLGLDLLDRLLLLALLRDALDVRSNGGIRIQPLCDAAGAASWAHQKLARSRLDTQGALRRHGLVESDADPAQADRLYRLAPRWKEPLLSGKAEAPPESFAIADTPAERLQAALSVAGHLLGRIAPDPEERSAVWSYAFPDRPGWDPAARCRQGLFELVRPYVAPDGEASRDPLACLLREVGAVTPPEAALLVLLLSRGADESPVSWAVLGVALDGVAPDPSPPPAASTSPLLRAGLVEVTPSPVSPLLATFRASADARARAVPAGLPAIRTTRLSLPDSSADMPALVERIEPRLSLDGVVLPRASRTRLTEALAIPAALASLAAADWGLEGSLLGTPGIALLFYGSPGTGKTLCAEAIAGQLGRSLWRLRTEQLLSKFVGETEKRLADVFAAARRKGDVVLVDEADSFLTTRESAVRVWEATMTNVLLQEIERFRGVVILTTNRDAVLDPALERRLIARIGFQLPCAEERRLLWERHIPSRVPRASDVDLKALATTWALSGSHIRTAALFALARAASREGDARLLTRADLEEAASAQAARATGKRPSVGFGTSSHRASRLALVAERRETGIKETP